MVLLCDELSETIGTLLARLTLSKAGAGSVCSAIERPEANVVSVYRVTDLIGTSTESWQDAATTAVKTAGKTLRDLRVAEVIEQDLNIDEGGAITYRTKLRVSFKYESEA